MGLLFINRGGCGSPVISKGRQTTPSLLLPHQGADRRAPWVCLSQADPSTLAVMALGAPSSEEPPLERAGPCLVPQSILQGSALRPLGE